MASRNTITQEHSQEHIVINGKLFPALDKDTSLVCGHFLLSISLRIRGIPLYVLNLPLKTNTSLTVIPPPYLPPSLPPSLPSPQLHSCQEMFNSQLQNSVVHRMSALLEEDMDHLLALKDTYDNSRQGLSDNLLAQDITSCAVRVTNTARCHN